MTEDIPDPALYYAIIDSKVFPAAQTGAQKVHYKDSIPKPDKIKIFPKNNIKQFYYLFQMTELRING